MKAVMYSGELNYRWAPVTAVSGTIGVAAYVLLLAANPSIPLAAVLASAFAFGITVSSIGLYQVLRGATGSRMGLVAATANVVAAGQLLAMSMVQLAVKAVLPQPDAALRAIWMGLDVAWDVYVGIGTIIFALCLFGRRSLGIWAAVPSVLIGCLFLTLNLATFPTPPADAGLVDLGPWIGLWYLMVYARLGASSVLLERQRRRSTFSPEGSVGLS